MSERRRSWRATPRVLACNGLEVFTGPTPPALVKALTVNDGATHPVSLALHLEDDAPTGARVHAQPNAVLFFRDEGIPLDFDFDRI